jgi:hypothetical protein
VRVADAPDGLTLRSAVSEKWPVTHQVLDQAATHLLVGRPSSHSGAGRKQCLSRSASLSRPWTSSLSAASAPHERDAHVSTPKRILKTLEGAECGSEAIDVVVGVHDQRSPRAIGDARQEGTPRVHGLGVRLPLLSAAADRGVGLCWRLLFGCSTRGAHQLGPGIRMANEGCAVSLKPRRRCWTVCPVTRAGRR